MEEVDRDGSSPPEAWRESAPGLSPVSGGLLAIFGVLGLGDTSPLPSSFHDIYPGVRPCV